jgi:chromosomal replication initiator protein
MVISDSQVVQISPYVIPGLKFQNMPCLDQEYKAKAIINKIAEYFNVSTEMIVSRSRKNIYITPRFWCAWFIRCNTNLSLKATGEILGGRDHTSILAAIKVIKGQLYLKHDNEFKDQYHLLIQLI